MSTTFPIFCPNCQAEPCITQILSGLQWSSCPPIPFPNIYETPIIFERIRIRPLRRFERSPNDPPPTPSSSSDGPSLLNSRDIHDRSFIRVRLNRMPIIFEEPNESTASDLPSMTIQPEWDIPRMPPPLVPFLRQDPRFPPRTRPMGVRRYMRLQGAHNHRESLDIDFRSDLRVYRTATRIYAHRPFLQPRPSSIGRRMRWAVEGLIRTMGRSIRRICLRTNPIDGATDHVELSTAKHI